VATGLPGLHVLGKKLEANVDGEAADVDLHVLEGGVCVAPLGVDFFEERFVGEVEDGGVGVGDGGHVALGLLDPVVHFDLVVD
jgi:hypothetical protein